MSNYIAGKSIVITGSGGGFGKLIAQKAAALGGRVTCGDIDGEAAEATAAEIRALGQDAQAVTTDVTDIASMKALVQAAVRKNGAVDVIVNNAGTMPLAFIAEHEAALQPWYRCIDTNFKGVLNGIVATYDEMVKQGHGHVINISSIYGNHPVVGAAVYGATKAAVTFMSDALRVESRGKIKVTTIKPTGVPGTGLAGTIVNEEATVGIFGHNMTEAAELQAALQDGLFPAERMDINNLDCILLDPQIIADSVVYAMNQPWGLTISDMTVRSAGEYFII